MVFNQLHPDYILLNVSITLDLNNQTHFSKIKEYKHDLLHGFLLHLMSSDNYKLYCVYELCECSKTC